MSVRKTRTTRPSDQNGAELVTPARRTRHSLVYAPSPLSTPSLSETIPFDWDAARGLKPPPYQLPNSARTRRVRHSIAVGPDSSADPQTPSPATPFTKSPIKKPRQSRVIVRTSWKTWLVNLPSQWWFQLTMLHHDLPLPAPKTIGRTVGIALHLIHALIRWSDIRNMRTDEDGWDDMRHEFSFIDEDEMEEESSGWFGWVRFTILS